MRHTVKLPKLGDTADEVVVIEWLADVGDRIEVSDPVLRVETSKVDTEVVSPVGGIVLEHLVRPGDEVSVGAPIIVVESA
ncbi:MAG TPA: biotin/lipoyl-containing protein [Acidimicrobiales bacterium]|nr:biotin/lipoyl-containing protein [Acidimicrobiales bacterium]